MSKRKSEVQGTPNTLFKYFSKNLSPAVKDEEKKKKLIFEKTESNNKPIENGTPDSPLNDSLTESFKGFPKTEDKIDMDISEDVTENGKIEVASSIKRLKDESEQESDSEEDIPKAKKKRRRIIQVSDSESGNENDSDHANVIQKQSKKEKKPKLENDDKNLSVSEKLSKITNSSEDNTKIMEKIEKSINEQVEKYELDQEVVYKHQTFDFLKPDKIKDKKGRRPDHPEYDPKTLYVPESFLNQQTPGLRQWWDIKSNHFDCVLFFKVGKFYEFYHMDAEVGVKELNCIYMKGDFAHSGFPEVSYDKMSSILIKKGYRVARIEQTETPDMMNERIKKQTKTTKFDKVVKREICQISNKGTQIFGSQCRVAPYYQPNYMLAICETSLDNHSEYGICFVDTTIGEFTIGQFKDDKNCSRILTLISHNPPVFVLYERNGISSKTQEIFKSALGNVMKESLLSKTQFWEAEKTLKFLAEDYYSKEETAWPAVLKLMQDENDHLGLTPKEPFKLALRSLGAIIYYLKNGVIDQQVLGMAQYSLYTPPDILANAQELKDLINETKINTDKLNMKKSNMVLDAITLANLRIVNSEHSLLTSLDFCCTKFGKRLLHNWLCAPSCDISIIKERQNAIRELLDNGEILQEIRNIFKTLPDFERHLAQLYGFSNGKRLQNHPDGRAILFEEQQYNKRKIQNFVQLIKGFEKIMAIPKIFSSFESSLIKRLTQHEPIGIFPEYKEVISYFNNSFDHEAAIKSGVVAPEKGLDAEYDSVENLIEDIKAELKEYLTEQEKTFKCRINYFGTDKKRYQLEIPDSHNHKVPKSYMLESQKKGFKRYHTNETKAFLKRMTQAEDKKNAVLKDLARRIYEKFTNHFDMWKQCVESTAIIDVLSSLAEYAKNQTNICTPELIEPESDPIIDIEDGFHPCIPSSNYIPNGIMIGGDSAPLALLTGPNMGGKSTLMREIGLLTIMAQIGCLVPAEKCKLSVVDRIFTRLGAQDDIISGHSTFLVELNETSAILKHATVNSLVLLDELGRGTATYDGTAIAASVVQFLSDLKCRTIFSTHYHSLVEYFHNNPNVYMGHMACMVENESNDDPTEETVTFLYKYTSGACPKSYGFNAAKLAGMPRPIIRRAFELSKKVESLSLEQKIMSKILCDSDDHQILNLLTDLKTCQIK
ncbi:probable DNA mismatch repair protein Msh6 [Condylostylus longicornis]|uniref:probable DNA mismatch repair protein Msh6 n=1 Tax=Condylostylus longicornis TaxID=2530218 RepID=UPI00244DD276|nr:probable DNA mismatch repair protein Msh6 [Condylostylus longicornis]